MERFRSFEGSTAAVRSCAARGADQKPKILRILVVDDDRMIGVVIARLLRGHRVTLETDPSAALARIRNREAFDHVLCDVLMPGVTGVDFYRALTDIDPALQRRLIFMSGGGYSPETARFLGTLENILLEKPFDLPTLMRALTRSL